MFIGMASVLMSLIFGTIIGAAAGYFGGWIDEISMQLMDVVLAIPETLLAICIVAAMATVLSICCWQSVLDRFLKWPGWFGLPF